MKIVTDTLRKAKTRRLEAERHKLRDEQCYHMSPRECLSPYMGIVAMRTAVSFFKRAWLAQVNL